MSATPYTTFDNIRSFFHGTPPSLTKRTVYSSTSTQRPLIDTTQYNVSFNPQHTLLELSVNAEEFARVSQSPTTTETVLHLLPTDIRGQIFEMILSKSGRLSQTRISQLFIVPEHVKHYSPDFMSSDGTYAYIGDLTATNDPIKGHGSKIEKYQTLFGHELVEHRFRRQLPVRYFAIAVGEDMVVADLRLDQNTVDQLVELYHYCDALSEAILAVDDNVARFFRGYVPILARALDALPDDFTPWDRNPYSETDSIDKVALMKQAASETDINEIISTCLDVEHAKRYINRYLLDRFTTMAGFMPKTVPKIQMDDVFYRPHELVTKRPIVETDPHYDYRSIRFLSSVPNRTTLTGTPAKHGLLEFDPLPEPDFSGLSDEIKTIRSFLKGEDIAEPTKSEPKISIAGLGLPMYEVPTKATQTFLLTDLAVTSIKQVQLYMNTRILRWEDDLIIRMILDRRPEEEHDRFTLHCLNIITQTDIYAHASFLSAVAGELLCNRHLFKQKADGEGNWHINTIPTYDAYVQYTMREDKVHFIVFYHEPKETSMVDICQPAIRLDDGWFRTSCMTYGAEQLKLLRLLPEQLASLFISAARCYPINDLEQLNESDAFVAIRLAYASAVLIKRELSNEIIDLRYVLLHSRSALTQASVGSALQKLVTKKRIVRDPVHAWLVTKIVDFVNKHNAQSLNNTEAAATEEIFGDSPIGKYHTQEQFIFLSYLGAESYPRQVPHVDVKYLATLAEQHWEALQELRGATPRVSLDVRLLAALLATEPQHSLFNKLDYAACLFEDPAKALSTKMLADDVRKEGHRSVVNYTATGPYIGKELGVGYAEPARLNVDTEIPLDTVTQQMEKFVREGMVLELTGKIGQKGGSARLITMQTASGRFANYLEQVVNNSIGVLPNCILRDSRSMNHLMDNHERKVRDARADSAIDLIPLYNAGCQIEDASKFNYLMSVRAMQCALIASCVAGAFPMLEPQDRPQNYQTLLLKSKMGNEICRQLIRVIKMSTSLNYYLNRRCYLNKSLEDALMKDNPEPHLSFLRDCFLSGGTGLAPKGYLHQWYGFGEGNLNATATILRYAHHLLKRNTWHFAIRAAYPTSPYKIVFDGQYASDDDFDVKTVLLPTYVKGRMNMNLIAEAVFIVTCAAANNLSMLVKPQKSTVAMQLGEIYSSYPTKGGGLLRPEMRPHLAMWSAFQDASPVDRYQLAFNECYTATQNYGPSVSASMVTLLEIAHFKSLAIDPRFLPKFIECSHRMSEPLLGLPSALPPSVGALSPHVHFQLGRLRQAYLLTSNVDDLLNYRVTAGRKQTYDLGDQVNLEEWSDKEFDTFVEVLLSGKSGRSVTIGGIVARTLQFYMSTLSGNIRHKVQNICSTPYLMVSPSVRLKRPDGASCATTWIACFEMVYESRHTPIETSVDPICDQSGDLSSPSTHTYPDTSLETLLSVGTVDQWKELNKLVQEAVSLGPLHYTPSTVRYFPRTRGVYHLVPATVSQSINTYRQVWLNKDSVYTKQILNKSDTIKKTPSITASALGQDGRRELVHKLNRAMARDRRLVYLAKGNKGLESYLQTLEQPSSSHHLKYTDLNRFTNLRATNRQAQMKYLLTSPGHATEALYNDACNSTPELLSAIRSRYTPPRYPIFGQPVAAVTPRTMLLSDIEIDNNFEGRISLAGTTSFADSIAFNLKDGNLILAQIVVTPTKWHAFTVSSEAHYLPRLYTYVRSSLATDPPKVRDRGLIDPFDMARPTGYISRLTAEEATYPINFKYASLEPHNGNLYARLVLGGEFEHKLRVAVYVGTEYFLSYPTHFLDNIRMPNLVAGMKQEVARCSIGIHTSRMVALSGYYFTMGVRGRLAKVIREYWLKRCIRLGVDMISAYSEEALSTIDVTSDVVMCNGFARYRHTKDYRSRYTHCDTPYIGTDPTHEDMLRDTTLSIMVPKQRTLCVAFMTLIRNSRHNTTLEIRKKASRDEHPIVSFLAWVMRELATERYKTAVEEVLISRPRRGILSTTSTPFAMVFSDYDRDRLEAMEESLYKSLADSVSQPLLSVFDYAKTESRQVASVIQISRNAPYTSQNFSRLINHTYVSREAFIEVTPASLDIYATIITSLYTTIFPSDKSLENSEYLIQRLEDTLRDATTEYIDNLSKAY